MMLLEGVGVSRSGDHRVDRRGVPNVGRTGQDSTTMVLSRTVVARTSLPARRSTRRTGAPRRSELQVVAGVADLVDVHGPGVEPPGPVDEVKGVPVAAGHDDLQR